MILRTHVCGAIDTCLGSAEEKTTATLCAALTVEKEHYRDSTDQP